MATLTKKKKEQKTPKYFLMAKPLNSSGLKTNA